MKRLSLSANVSGGHSICPPSLIPCTLISQYLDRGSDSVDTRVYLVYLGVCILVRILIRLIGGWYICLLRIYMIYNIATIRVG